MMLQLHALVLSLCFTAGSASNNNCRPGWRFFNGACYGYSQTKVPWAEAAATCKVYGAKLTEIETSEENTFIRSLAREKGDLGVWLGASDIFQEGTWEWISGKSLYPLNPSDWVPDQPSDWEGLEECLSLWDRYDYKWNDAKCDQALNFICEKESSCPWLD